MVEMTPIKAARGWFARIAPLLLLAACGSQESPAIVDKPPSYGLIEAVPFLTVEGGTPSGGQQHARIKGAYRLRDRSTVVGGERQLRWYSPSGKLIRSVPPIGQSANRDFTWVRGYSGDSLVAYDAVSAELIVIDAQGTVARQFGFDTGFLPEMIMPHTVLPDGSLLAVAGPSHLQQWQDGWWAVLSLLSVSPAGAKTRSLGTALRHPCGQSVEGCAAEFKEYSGTWTAGQRGVYVARPDRAEIRWMSNDSAVNLKGPEGWARRPEEGIPTYSNLIIDPSDNLWAQSGDLSRAAVFTPEGELIGTLEVPPNLQIHQVGRDFVVGIVAQAGNERVQVHQLRRMSVPAPHEGDGGDYTSDN